VDLALFCLQYGFLSQTVRIIRKGARSVFNKLFFKNSAVVISANFLPSIASLLLIPLIINKVGVDDFGVFSVLLGFILVLSTLDLGANRAVTKFGCDWIEDNKGFAALFYSLILTLMFGVFLAVGLFLCKDIIILNLFDEVSGARLGEIRQTIIYFAISAPFMVSIPSLNAFLEYCGKFKTVSFIKVPSQISLLLFIYIFSDDFQTAFFYILLIKVLHFGALVVVSISMVELKINFDKEAFSELFRFNVWLSADNLISPFLAYAERFVISSLISVSVVAYFTTNYDLVSKILLLTGSMMTVIFPMLNRFNNQEKVKLYSKSINLMLIVLTPVVLGIILISNFLLEFWVNSEFAENSYMTLNILAVGAFFLALSNVPFSALHSKGKTKTTTVIHIVELLFYYPTLFFLIRKFGVNGAALTWSLRCFIDFLLMDFWTRCHMKINKFGQYYLILAIALMFVFTVYMKLLMHE
jgi:O-antigen/teichoic acid export membrane protein